MNKKCETFFVSLAVDNKHNEICKRHFSVYLNQFH